LEDRKTLIAKLEALCSARVICYATSDRGGQETQIGDDAGPVFYQHLRAIGNVDRLALLLYSRGGQTMTGFAISNAMRELAKEVTVLVPFRAHSCATLIALSGNKIVMGPFGQLSPIDPSITSPHGPNLTQGTETKFIPVSVEDVAGYFSLARAEAKVAEDRMNEVLAHLCTRVNPLALGAVYRAREQIGMLARKLLKKHLDDESKIERIINALTRQLLSHDYVIGRTEAKDIGLPIEDATPDVADAMWGVYTTLAEEMKFAQPWNVEIELGTQQSVKRTNMRAVIESLDLKHCFATSHELKRTTLVKDGMKFDAVQGKIIDEGWRESA